jgi:hypothetical protein
MFVSNGNHAGWTISSPPWHVSIGFGGHVDEVTEVQAPAFGGYRWRPMLLDLLAYYMLCGRGIRR